MSWDPAHGHGGRGAQSHAPGRMCRWAAGTARGECAGGQLAGQVGRTWLVLAFPGQARTKGSPSPPPTPSFTGKRASHSPSLEQRAPKERVATFLLPSIIQGLGDPPGPQPPRVLVHPASRLPALLTHPPAVLGFPVSPPILCTDPWFPQGGTKPPDPHLARAPPVP